MSFHRTGGCLCGAVRFELTERPTHNGYCRCRMCQRATGASVSAGLALKKSAFRLTRGEPKRYRSSEAAYRRFCGDCGWPLFFEGLGAPDSWEVLAARSTTPPGWR